MHGPRRGGVLTRDEFTFATNGMTSLRNVRMCAHGPLRRNP